MTFQTTRKTRQAPPAKPGVYSTGVDTVNAILDAAEQVLIEEGASGFTLRRVAARCGLRVGNVSRHFPRKEMLVQVLLEQLLSPSEGEVRKNIVGKGMPADKALALVISGSLSEIQTERMTRLFTELWAMANHSDFVAERVELVYRYVHNLISRFVAELNPNLSQDEVEIVSVYISASIEGTTVLAGNGKPWSAIMPQIKGIAVKFLVDLARTITSKDIQELSVMASGIRSDWGKKAN